MSEPHLVLGGLGASVCRDGLFSGLRRQMKRANGLQSDRRARRRGPLTLAAGSVPMGKAEDVGLSTSD